MRLDKNSAIELRKAGKSYNAISLQLGVPKSTLSEWFSDTRWSHDIKLRLTDRAFLAIRPQFIKMAEANRIRWELWREEARREAKRDFLKYRKEILFCKGIMLYWGEGDKNPRNPVRVSNIDPSLLRTFVDFLKKYAKKHTIKAHLVLYPDLKESLCKNYWSPRINIPLKDFYKTQFIKGRHKTRRLNYGIGAVTVGSRQLKEKVLKWIDLYSNE